jgi:hypothetical protein
VANDVLSRCGTVLFVLLCAAVALVASACSAGSPAMEAGGSGLPPCDRNAPVACSWIDGFPVGNLYRDCGTVGRGCDEDVALARLALDARDAGHAEPVLIQEFGVDMDKVCGSQTCAFSSQQLIVVFTFADGSHAATGYQCAGIEPCVGTRTWDGWDDAIAMPTP